MSGLSERDIAYHDAIADEYDRVVVQPREPMNRLLFRPLARHVKPGRAMLDLGCGTGHMIRRFGAGFEHVLGVDHSAGMLATARDNLAAAGLEHVHLRQDNVTHVLTGDARQRYDLIACVGCLHHLARTEAERLLGQIAARLRSNDSVAILAEPISDAGRGAPAPIRRWNAGSVAVSLDYTANPEEPDEAPVSRHWLLQQCARAGLSVRAESRAWEIFPRRLPAGVLDRVVIAALHRLYGAGGNVMALAAGPSNG